ncbi:acyltransferase family protein [Rhizobium multihospitium]|uniref:Peptidoglycan/LPS O-acetylase OafA/YrhL, contains acyltransferase and SGNH-hydrolase domains n=1 Tax=Rhizobium multihospitium TaxID=410764 RepID=A0A1C3X0M6_9HYPH|nr:acyltransferase [Rhizobium multihospitium]SCB45676.1 Peptidoglycan/LPS O-acetylase OafA/YrhL, contains acyltransferase and SGNH-hydrolase domains [Rhizobium multihospitium]
MLLGEDKVPKTAPTKLTPLEAMRGIASIIVMFHHFCLAFLPWIKEPFPKGLAATPFAWLMRGESAVTFFFVLSGFVLALKFYRRPDYKTLLASTLKRLPRLMGPAAISIGFGFLILFFHLNYNAEAALITGSDWLRTFGDAPLPPGFTPTPASAIRQSLLVFLLPDQFWYNSNLWTMRFEYYGSLLVFLLCALTMRASSIVQLLSMIVSAYLLWTYVHPFLPFIAGAYLAFLVTWSGPRAINNIWIAAFISLVSILLLCSLDQHLKVAGSIGLLVSLIFCPKLARPLSGKLGRLLGRFSLPLYLAHFLVIASASSFGFTTIYDWSGSYAWAAVIAGIITILVSLVAATPLLLFDEWWVATVNTVAATLSKSVTTTRRTHTFQSS